MGAPHTRIPSSRVIEGWLGRTAQRISRPPRETCTAESRVEATESVFCWGTRDQGRTSIVPAWCSNPTRRTRPGEKAHRRVFAVDSSTASRTANFPALLIGGTPGGEAGSHCLGTGHQSPGQGHTTEGVHMSERHMIHKGEYVLRPECRDAVALHEQVYREMGEQQAESREARRTRAVNRPRGRAGADEDGE